MNKRDWLAAAEVFDAWRVIPRLVLFAYGYFVWSVTSVVLQWYIHEPPAARGIEESGTVAAIFGIVTGLAPWVFKIYSENGRDWNAQQNTSTTVTSTKTVTS